MRVEILGKRWNLKTIKRRKRRKYYGTCDHPETPNKEIVVEINHEDQISLDTLLHECLHAGFPDVSEAYVTQWATDVAKIVTEQGWKREKP